MSSTEAEEIALRKAVRIDRYAEILAHVVHFGSERTGEVVNRFCLSLEQWRSIDAGWTNMLGTPGQTHALALGFSSTFHAHRERLAQEQPALASLVVPQVHFPDKPERTPASVAANPSGVPSFMPGTSPAPSATASVSPWAAYSAPPGQLDAPSAMETPPAPLPFVHGVAAEVALQAAVEHAHKAQGTTSTSPADSLGATKAIDENDISAIARQITPFGGLSTRSEGRPTRDPELTLEQHASLHVELEMHPADAAEILGRYGLTTEQHSRIDIGWEALEQYRAWVSSNRAR